ncbi:alpha/beta fold hydrolase [Halomicrobium katesii]|uniref:alpha/beta fold hydrolase n=1 Tax=Halomicrobium katesii TaxID=437163 RepID=UPI00037DBAAC|nr:alpha/beta hydrolase [Halomicrobium katesii]
MPTATADGVAVHYEREGDGETVAFVNDVGAGAWLWSWQHGVVAGPYESLVWDLRGTGRSDAPPGPYSVDRLAADLEAVFADAGVARVHLVGAGLGGMVALAYAHEYDRGASLTLFGTAASGDAVTDKLDDLRAPLDDRAALETSLQTAFASDLTDHPTIREELVEWRQTDDAEPAAWDAQAAAMRAFEAPSLYEITLPTLVLHGVDDEIVPASAGESLAADLPRGEYRAVEGGHWAFIEESAAVSDALVGWLDEQSGED